MSRYSLWNPFLVSAFHDPRTFKDDDGGSDNGGGGSSGGGGSNNNNTMTNQDRINELYESSDDPWGEHGDELNALVNDRDGTYTGGETTTTSTTTTATTSSSDKDDGPQLSATAAAQVGTVAQDENGDWYAVVQNPNSNTLGRDYSIDPKDDSKGPTFGGNVSDNVETLFPEEVEAAGGSSEFEGSILDTFKDTDVPSAGFDAATNTYTYEPAATQTFDEAFAENRAAGNETFTYNGKLYTTELAPELTGEELLMSQDVVTQPTGLPTEVAPDFFDQFGPTIDYTVSQGEAGRGGDDTAAPTFNYQPNLNPELEMLVSLKNSGVDLEPNEYLKATVYEKEKNASISEPGVSVASAVTTADLSPTITNPRIGYESGQDALQSAPAYMTGLDGSGPNTVGQVTDAFYGQGPGVDVSPAYAIQDAAELAEMADRDNDGVPDGSIMDTIIDALTLQDPISLSMKSTGAGDLAAGIKGVGAFGDIIGSYDIGNYQVIDPNTGQTVNASLSGSPKPPTTAASEFVQPAVDYFQDVSQSQFEKIPQVLQDEMTASQFTGSFEDLKNLNFPTVGEATPRGVALNAAGELIDIGKDVAAIAINPTVGIPYVFGSSFFEGGGSAAMEIDAKLDEMEKSGALASNPDFQTLSGAYENALLSQGVDPGLAKGQGDASAKEALRQEAYKPGVIGAGLTAATFDTLLSTLASPLKGVFKAAPGVVRVPATATAGGVGEAGAEGTEQAITNVAQIAGLGATDVKVGDQVGGQAVSAFFPGTSRGITAIPNQNVDPNTFVPTSATAGQPAQSPPGVQSAYEEAAESMKQAGISNVGDVDGGTTMEAMAAQEIINDLVATTGGVDQNVLNNLQDSTGLSMNELSQMVANAGTRRVGSETIPVDIPAAPKSDALTDEATGIGGGSNIQVIPNADGTTTLVNTDTGRQAEVDANEDLGNAIQVFDETTTAIDDQTTDLRAQAAIEALDGVNQVDAAPVVPAAETSINIEDIPSRLNLTDAKSLGPNIDLSSIPSNLNLSLPTTPEIQADPELTTVYHATKGAPFTQFDPTQGDNYYSNMGAFGPGFYGSLDTTYPSDYVGGVGSLMSAQIDMSNMLDAKNNKPLTETQTTNLQNALENRTDSQGNSLKVSQDGNTLSVEYVRKAAFSGESEADRTVTRTIDTTNPTDVFQKVNLISENIKNPLATDNQGLVLESEQDGDTQNLKSVLTDAGFTGVVGVADTGAGQSGDADNVVVFDENLVGNLDTVIDQDSIPTSAADLVQAQDNNPNQDAAAEVVLDDDDAVAAVPFTSERTDTGADTEATATPEFTSVRGTDTDTDVAAVVEVADNITAEPETEGTVEPETLQNTEVEVEVETKPKVEVETKPKVEVETDPTIDVTPRSTVNILPVEEEDEEEEVEVEPEVEVEEPMDVLVPPITTTDKDGNTITECPEGYTTIETADGPMCQKTVSSVRQRKGISSKQYIQYIENERNKGMAGNVGRVSPGQRRKTVTSTRRVRPTIRSA